MICLGKIVERVAISAEYLQMAGQQSDRLLLIACKELLDPYFQE